MRFFPVKTEAQQIVLSLHRLRAHLMKTRIMQTNKLRGLLYEFSTSCCRKVSQRCSRPCLPPCAMQKRGRSPMLMDSQDQQPRQVRQLPADFALPTPPATVPGPCHVDLHFVRLKALSARRTLFKVPRAHLTSVAAGGGVQTQTAYRTIWAEGSRNC